LVVQVTANSGDLESRIRTHGIICWYARTGLAKGVMKELKCEITVPTPFLVDSQSGKDLAENPVFH
jgi:hypothetical protein